MKVRFVGGPFGGQVKEMGVAAGTNHIVMRGPKKMTPNQRYEYMMTSYGATPMIEARYRIAMRTHTNGTSFVNMPCMHPDGSFFYEYEEGSKREL